MSDGIVANSKCKVNLHILEPCNYRCKHCFAHFNTSNILPVEQWMSIVDNCMATGMVSEFNIAGGEPLLYANLGRLISYIKSKGAKCSIITNGLLMTDEWIEQNVRNLDTIGFSIDSFLAETMVAMGRCDCNGRFLTVEQFKNNCKEIRKRNKRVKIKVNTVITALNKNELMSEILKSISINKWKILKMSVFQTDSFDNTALQVSNEEYYRFVRRNLERMGILSGDVNATVGAVSTREGIDVVIENTMTNTYIMIDSSGYLVDNSSYGEYKRVIDCKKENFQKGLQLLNINWDLYFARYKMF